MRTIDLGKHRRARVWLGELPPATYSVVGRRTHSVTAGRRPRLASWTSAAVEISIPLGGRALYGLLGGHWRAASEGLLVATVEVALSDGTQLTENLAGGNDEVRVGLPREYADGVLDGIDLAKGELGDVPCGELEINCAAHGAIGSSQAGFKHLGSILIKLFCLTALPSEDELSSLFPTIYS